MMYQLFSTYFNPSQMIMIGVLFTFFITFLALKFPLPFLPVDQGREFAINGGLSKGKIRGVGLTFVLCFIIGSIFFLPIDREYIIYLILLFCVMLSGYLDDAADTPWSDYKKGFIDLIISIVTMLTFVNYNSTVIHFFEMELVIPKTVYIILGIILIWVSINVTNCSDGVDGLCGSLCTVSVISFSLIFKDTLGMYMNANFLFAAVLLAYLYFNTSPSSMLMGDAGSRALGFYLAIITVKSGHPFLYLLLAAVLIIDGGLGLVKIFLKRFLKISILKNTRTPIHDHLRKNHNWSDTQVVIRFIIIQVICSVIAFLLLV